jgi:hypothetical protein
MRSAIVVIAVCATVCAAPLVFGGIVVTALAATLTEASPTVAASACAAGGPVGSASAAGIDAWITREVPGSPLAGIGAAMVAGASGSGLDPRLLAAIALQETRLGTAGGGPAVYTPFGLGPGLAFPSWSAAIDLAVHTLAAMHAAGAQTIAEIARHWAPVGAANDPTGLNDNWAGGVAAAYAALGGDPAGRVFGLAAPACPSAS